MSERGITEDEVRAALKGGETTAAKGGRISKEATFDFAGEWRGRRYPQKRVRVVYVEERGRLVVITAYAFYGRW